MGLCQVLLYEPIERLQEMAETFVKGDSFSREGGSGKQGAQGNVLDGNSRLREQQTVFNKRLQGFDQPLNPRRETRFLA